MELLIPLKALVEFLYSNQFRTCDRLGQISKQNDARTKSKARIEVKTGTESKIESEIESESEFAVM